MLNYAVFFAITAGIFAVLCLGLNIQWGYTGLFNIGIAGFYAIGAYTSALLSGPPPGPMDWRVVGGFQFPWPVGFVGAALVSGLIAFFIGLPTLKLKEDYLAIATIGIAEVIRLVLKNESWLTNSVWGIKHIPAPLASPIEKGIRFFLEGNPQLPSWLQSLLSNGYNWFYLGLVIFILAALYLISEKMIRSPWGRVLRAIREDEIATATTGKNIFWFKMQSLVLGAMIMGMAGSLYAHYARFIDASSFEPFFGTFLIWVMLIVGGSGNNLGAIVGAFVIWGVWAGTEFLTSQWGLTGYRAASLRIISVGVILEIILIMRPRGILGEEKVVSLILKSKK
ncbi:branched-chain amino acid ABC transporter permease [Candidatus Aerophobetes bacterium]|uniref:Branched-chain amino acid ABC transporter permease n=1 Tax=Aerophobetes bacterium TaxID=2030807 RepID=A0A662DF03_UNCAE|nr:MAG: branched-chain amino acid ABC transporter permease [Candidatus Aerophobetes bacterium]